MKKKLLCTVQKDLERRTIHVKQHVAVVLNVQTRTMLLCISTGDRETARG